MSQSADLPPAPPPVPTAVPPAAPTAAPPAAPPTAPPTAGAAGPAAGPAPAQAPVRPHALDQLWEAMRRTGIRRPTDDRWVGGVCSGTARRLGVDPVLLRVALAATLLLGGVGVVLYAVALVLLPDHDGRIELERASYGDLTGTTVGAVALLLLAIVTPSPWALLAGGDLVSGSELVGAVVTGTVLLVGLALLPQLREALERSSGRAPGSPAASDGWGDPGYGWGSGTGVPGSAWDAGAGPGPGASSSAAYASGAPRASAYGSSAYGSTAHGSTTHGTASSGADAYGADAYEADTYRADTYGTDTYGADAYRADAYGHDGYGVGVRGGYDVAAGHPSGATAYGRPAYGPPPAPRPPRPVKAGRRGPGPVVSAAATGGALVAAGAAWLASSLDLLPGRPAVLAACAALLVLGAVLVGLGVAGRRDGGVGFTTFLVLAALAWLLLVPSWQTAQLAGERTFVPRDVTEAGRGGTVGMGDGILDLRGLEDVPAGAGVDVPVRVGLGELTVLVPEGMDVRVDASTLVGSTVLGAEGDSSDEVGGIAVERSVLAASDPQVVVDARVLVGVVRVVPVDEP